MESTRVNNLQYGNYEGRINKGARREERKGEGELSAWEASNQQQLGLNRTEPRNRAIFTYKDWLGLFGIVLQYSL